MTTERFDPLDLQRVDEIRKRKKLTDDESIREDAELVRWLMSSTKGRRFLWKRLERAGVFNISFNTNAMTMAFAEGNRNQGLMLLDLINRHALEQYTTMVRENLNDNGNKDGRRKHQSGRSVEQV